MLIEEPMLWEDDELFALAEAWCCTSQNEIRGNDQDQKSYWETIRWKFQQALGKGSNYRSTDSLTSIWATMKTKLTKFNGIHQRLARNPPSGWNEAKILTEALELYKRTTKNNPFPHLAVWSRIRDEPKWRDVIEKGSVSSGSKRSYGDSSMGSDAHINVDLNADDDTVEEVNPLHDRPQRGRDKAKRTQLHGEKLDAKTLYREKIARNLDAQMAMAEEKRIAKQKQLEDHEELVNQQKLINHLTIIDKVGVDEEDKPLMMEARKQSVSWLKKFFKK